MAPYENEDLLKADAATEDAQLEAIKAHVEEMEEESTKLKQMQSEVDRQLSVPITRGSKTAVILSSQTKEEVDNRSVYIGNVEYSATAKDLEDHFHGCGAINRVTILCDKFNGSPKGFAYIEFVDEDAVETAKALDESLFKGRQIKVMPKRTNRPGISTTNRGKCYRGRGAFRGRVMGFGAVTRPRYRGRAAFYSPY